MERLQNELRETRQRLKSTKEQLVVQGRRARHLAAACATKVAEKEREMQMMRLLKDGQLQTIIRKLLHFESLLRQEQKRIQEVVRQKDHVISEQAAELQRLNNRFAEQAGAEQDATVSASSCNNMTIYQNKENLEMVTPLVTKMVRRFEVSQKPEVPQKPARLVKRKVSSATGTSASVNVTPVKVVAAEGVAVQSSDSDSQENRSSGMAKGVSRANSVTDHGYFTLEKRRSKVSSNDQVDVFETSETLQTSQISCKDGESTEHGVETSTMMLMLTPTRVADDCSSGDGGDWDGYYPTEWENSGSQQWNSPVASGHATILLPQMGDATPKTVQFDRFLDASGLTQKSILTPSRLLSNHKNMLKPKDIKHRNKVKSVLGCRPHEEVSTTNQVRCYFEPFL